MRKFKVGDKVKFVRYGQTHIGVVKNPSFDNYSVLVGELQSPEFTEVWEDIPAHNLEKGERYTLSSVSELTLVYNSRITKKYT